MKTEKKGHYKLNQKSTIATFSVASFLIGVIVGSLFFGGSFDAQGRAFGSMDECKKLGETATTFANKINDQNTQLVAAQAQATELSTTQAQLNQQLEAATRASANVIQAQADLNQFWEKIRPVAISKNPQRPSYCGNKKLTIIQRSKCNLPTFVWDETWPIDKKIDAAMDWIQSKTITYSSSKRRSNPTEILRMERNAVYQKVRTAIGSDDLSRLDAFLQSVNTKINTLKAQLDTNKIALDNVNKQVSELSTSVKELSDQKYDVEKQQTACQEEVSASEQAHRDAENAQIDLNDCSSIKATFKAIDDKKMEYTELLSTATSEVQRLTEVLAQAQANLSTKHAAEEKQVRDTYWSQFYQLAKNAQVSSGLLNKKLPLETLWSYIENKTKRQGAYYKRYLSLKQRYNDELYAIKPRLDQEIVTHSANLASAQEKIRSLENKLASLAQQREQAEAVVKACADSTLDKYGLGDGDTIFVRDSTLDETNEDSQVWISANEPIVKSINGVEHEVTLIDVPPTEDSCIALVDNEQWIINKGGESRSVSGIKITVLDAIHTEGGLDNCLIEIEAFQTTPSDATTASLSDDEIYATMFYVTKGMSVVYADSQEHKVTVQSVNRVTNFAADDQCKISVDAAEADIGVGQTKTINGVTIKVEAASAQGEICRISFPTESVSPRTCSDTDNTVITRIGGGISNPPGIDRNVFGSVTYGRLRFDDICALQQEYIDIAGNHVIRMIPGQTGNYVMEKGCLDNRVPYEVSISPCAFGCENGACKKEVTYETCTDSDGNNQYTKGTVKGPWNADPSGTVEVQSDLCTPDGKTLNEMTCEFNSELKRSGIVQKPIDCQYGCLDGACLPAPASTPTNQNSATDTAPTSISGNVLLKSAGTSESCINFKTGTYGSCADIQMPDLKTSIPATPYQRSTYSIKFLPGASNLVLLQEGMTHPYGTPEKVKMPFFINEKKSFEETTFEYCQNVVGDKVGSSGWELNDASGYFETGVDTICVPINDGQYLKVNIFREPYQANDGTARHALRIKWQSLLKSHPANPTPCSVDAMKCNLGYTTIKCGEIITGWNGNTQQNEELCKIMEGTDGSSSNWALNSGGCAIVTKGTCGN